MTTPASGAAYRLVVSSESIYNVIRDDVRSVASVSVEPPAVRAPAPLTTDSYSLGQGRQVNAPVAPVARLAPPPAPGGGASSRWWCGIIDSKLQTRVVR